MTKYVINGGKTLNGEVTISGAKNAAVAIVPAALLADGPVRIENVPKIIDVTLQMEIMRELGAQIRLINSTTVEIQNTQNPSLKPHELERKLRASYYLLGVLLGKYGFAEVAMPGGCNFGGVRPIDQHIKGFEALGAKVTLPKGGYIRVEAPEDGLHGAHIYFDVVTVGATMNIMLAAVLAKGQTIMENCAKEPHIVDLANFLNALGADVKGAGTDVIKIRGVESLHGGSYSIIPDQIEAGTFMAAAAACQAFGYNIHQIEYAAEVSLEHHLGLTCDPICGLVQVPCIERNAVAAMRAINSANIAYFLTGTRNISYDMVLKSMYYTGLDMNQRYRETAEGGLARIYTRRGK